MEPEKENKEDIVAFDIPLFIRLLEFAREDATDDETLHKITDKIIDMCLDGQVLSMNQYDEIINISPEVDTSNMNSLSEQQIRWLKIAGIR
jgi:hypothetical protein